MDQARLAAKADDPRVKAALAEYMERVDRGEQVDREQFLAAHADIADELGSFITTSEELARLASPARPESEAQSISTRSLAGRDQETLIPQRVKESPADSKAPGLPEQFGRYKILKPLGSGAMGTVYLAEDTQLHRKVAIKTPSFEQDETGELLERHRREARSAATLRHPHICPVFDIGEIGGKHFITMAYIEGRPLSAYIRPDKLQAERQTLVAVRKLALALQEAHDHNIIHRDLKPGNIMIDGKGEPIVMDFGLARKVHREDASRLTQSGMIVGSPAYMSPEQVEGDPDKLGPAADQYSLGVILYELLTGQLPFRGSVTAVIGAILTKEPTPVTELRPGIDPRIAALCQRMMKKSASERYPSMKAVAEAIAAILKDAPGEAMKETVRTVERPAKPQATQGVKTEKGAEAAAAVSITASNVTSLLEAAQKCMRKHDYEQVVQMLQQIPEQRRTDEVRALLTKARQLADEVAFLLAEIDEAERVNDNAVLTRATDELLKLKPKHHKALQIKDELSRYGTGKLWKPGGYTPDGRRIGEGSWIPWLGIAVGVIAFAATLWAVTIYLKAGDAVVRVQINNPDVKVSFQGRTLHIQNANKEFKVEPGENTLQITYGDSEFETDKFTLKDGENPAVVVELLDKTLAAKFGEESIGQWDVKTPAVADTSPVEPVSADTTPPTATTAAASASPVPADAVAFQGHSYKYFGETLSWKEAKQRCEQLGGHLPIVETAAENAFLTQLAGRSFPNPLGGKESIWLGATDEVTEGEWRWVDGTRAEYLNWRKLPGNAPGTQPNNKGGVEHYATLWLSHDPNRASGLWSDQPNVALVDGQTVHLICEWDELRSTTTGSAAQVAWTDLFNGTDLTGWHTVGDEGWTAQNGVLTGAPGDGWIATDRDFTNFELELDFRLSAGANSGVFLRIPDQGALSGGDFMEVQLIDETVQANVETWQRTGAVYAVQGPTPPPNPAVGQWHQLTIRADGPEITISIDGSEVNRVNLDTAPVVGPPKRDLRRPGGHIGFQHRGQSVEFRNIRIRELSPATSAAAANAANTPRAAQPLPRNEWITLDPSAPRATSWNWGKPLKNPENKKWENGVLSLDNAAVAFNQVQAKDVSFRAKVRFLEGNNMALVVRGEHGKGGVYALFDKQNNGQMYVAFLNTNKSKVLALKDDYFDFQVDAIGDQVSIQVNGQTVVRHRETQKLKAGHIEVTAYNARGMFKEMAVKILDEAPAAAAAATESDWTDLFNGTDLTGWTPVNTAGVWSVQNGVLTANTGDGWLATDRDYSDFELELEYRLPPGGNTGVFVRVPENADPGGKGLLEVQAIDDTFPQFQNVPDRNRTGAVVGLFAASPRADAPPNAWNKLAIRAVGPRITVVVNGRKISEGSLADQPQAALTPEMQLPSGRIGLQCRPATGVEFRNIRIHDLSAGSASVAPQADGWSDLFNGTDLTGWQPMETLGAGGDQHRPTTGGWEARNGELVCSTDQPGWLKSAAQYGDFEFETEFKVPAGGNSDIYVRCPGSGRLSRSGMAIQIIDEHSGKFTMDPTNRPGAIWGVVGHEIASVTRPLGEWNSLSIRCEGDRVQVSINGQQTVDANMQAVAELRDRPRSGFIGLANWGGEAKGIAFRNMRIRDLSSGKEDTAALQGKWTAIGQEIAGGVWTQEQIVEHEKSVSFAGDTFEIRYRDRTGQFQVERGTYRLDPTHDPAHITMNGTNRDGRDFEFLGIYQLEGDQLRHCFVKTSDDRTAVRPTSFSTSAGSGRFSTTYRRD